MERYIFFKSEFPKLELYLIHIFLNSWKSRISNSPISTTFLVTQTFQLNMGSSERYTWRRLSRWKVEGGRHQVSCSVKMRKYGRLESYLYLFRREGRAILKQTLRKSTPDFLVRLVYRSLAGRAGKKRSKLCCNIWFNQFRMSS